MREGAGVRPEAVHRWLERRGHRVVGGTKCRRGGAWSWQVGGVGTAANWKRLPPKRSRGCAVANEGRGGGRGALRRRCRGDGTRPPFWAAVRDRAGGGGRGRWRRLRGSGLAPERPPASSPRTRLMSARRRARGCCRPSSAPSPSTRRSRRWTCCSTSWPVPSTFRGEPGPPPQHPRPPHPLEGGSVVEHPLVSSQEEELLRQLRGP